ncbi:hypothetical protein DO021_15440 [Desulfobacter hydrogenophilus]|uniref:Uncharacterized protein n=1 Tax=Desulfobacter hydrogenophilus TaxID=2291 RepID=A0A328F8Y8_9BACT|nr:hypothetical protein [Desulfobacter hydrogenophilus]NDY73075.1 hypothetical protein [Desulfobacter hydrogenophilus]QBH13575.1 hypothetical protein EYB58_11945 [Desulfobacter hydrogenophilus]RAM01081.1 hypothetical protein DO021_15440 [Desulfobacter hydrogenophilus]
MKTVIPDENSMNEIAGRVYEAIDIQRGIEEGNLKTIDDVLKFVKQSSERLSRVLKCSQWIYNDNCCLDVKKTLENKRNRHRAGSGL